MKGLVEGENFRIDTQQNYLYSLQVFINCLFQRLSWKNIVYGPNVDRRILIFQKAEVRPKFICQLFVSVTVGEKNFYLLIHDLILHLIILRFSSTLYSCRQFYTAALEDRIFYLIDNEKSRCHPGSTNWH